MPSKNSWQMHSMPTYTRLDENRESVCWHCCHPKSEAQGSSIAVPTDHGWEGSFCSLSCAYAYMLALSMIECEQNLPIFKDAYDVSEIQPAPPRRCLKMFGGFMDIETFRANASRLTVEPEQFVSSVSYVWHREESDDPDNRASGVHAARVRGIRKKTEGPLAQDVMPAGRY